MVSGIRFIGLSVLSLALISGAQAEDLTNAIRAYLQQRIDLEHWDVGMVIGLVDEQGSRVLSYGNMDIGTAPAVNGDTVFELGSITKTFTALLLQDMVERGEMKLDDPVVKYLPQSVKMPTRNGKEITLLHLATHTSGLPLLPYNLEPKRADNPYADYTVEKLYAFLASYQLPFNPGAKMNYSEVGMELLGHVISLKAGTNYESLVVGRICQPLNMDNTRVTMTPELKSRCVTGHNELGYAVPSLEFQTLVGGSGLHSTANDLLKYVAAHLGLTKSRVTPLMEKTHAIHYRSLKGGKFGLGWAIVAYPQGREFIMHGGATPGCTTYIVFDMARRRGVVVMASSASLSHVCYLGQRLLESEWRTERRPTATKSTDIDTGLYAGEYQLTPNIALGMLTLRAVLINVPKPVFVIAAGIGLIVILLIALVRRIAFIRKIETRFFGRWRAVNRRTRRIILGSAVLVGGLLTPLITARVVCEFAHPVVNIRRAGDRLFAEGTSSSRVVSKWKLPSITGELLPESPANFFERMSGTPVIFSHDARGKMMGLTAPLFGTKLSFAKAYDQAGAPPKPPVAIKLDEKFCDACVGQYEFAPDDFFLDGINLTIWREGDRLLGNASDKNGRWGAFDIYPESETNFFFTLTVIGVQLTFIKNDKGEVTSVVRHTTISPDCIGKKLGSK